MFWYTYYFVISFLMPLIWDHTTETQRRIINRFIRKNYTFEIINFNENWAIVILKKSTPLVILPSSLKIKEGLKIPCV